MYDPDLIRLSFFLCALILCGLWEWRSPRKRLTQSKSYRWFNNLGLVAFNSVCLTLLMPILAFEAALIASQNQWGLFYLLDLPFVFTLAFCVVLLDLAVYLQHLIFHKFPILWRLHRMHHADQDIDITTGSRFHPLEILISVWVKITVVVILGVPPMAVIVFEVVLNVSAMFNHSNAKLPLKLDAAIRTIMVTPDMHRVHHSVIARETHSNFGFCLSVWDRRFGTYIAQPELGHDKVKIGLPLFRKVSEQRLDKMLTQPFRNH
ncbi:sterol desaturase family protein [Vibrio ostreicida]|uniref:Sterol desaturase family protein n=1 Tax=Vibrio ostreicida TaxID=526588 RepID=A0ABT8BV34_9VIBR|nr:sterol desaturase family protein [Vibrio ostreicida]MDN3609953.1 sterol desaturase family protein [Vibrio ostreicida]NPD10381.1 sterol desaturase family protein [Vibrio ostreicida]